jgi:hypothetical protein
MLFAGLPLLTNAQEKYRYETNSSGLCSASIDLFKDNRYIFERGCEEGSRMNYGYWELNKDTLTLVPLNNKLFDVIDTIVSIGDDTVIRSIKILDKHGIDISEKVWISFRTGDKELGSMEANELPIPFEKDEGGKIGLLTLERLFGQKLEFPLTAADRYLVKLTISEDYIYSAYSHWYDIGIAKFRRVNNMFISIPREDEQVLYFIRSNR